MLRNPYHVPHPFYFGIPNPRGVAWFYLALAALAVALIAGTIYVVDRWRRREHPTPDLRGDGQAPFTVLERSGVVVLLVYTLVVFGGAVWVAMQAIEIAIHPAYAPWTSADTWALLVAFGVFAFHLLVVPAAGFTFLLSRRHRRRYPEDLFVESARFERVTRGVLVANAATIVLIVLIELSGTVGEIPGSHQILSP